jgi:hypothetical protein
MSGRSMPPELVVAYVPLFAPDCMIALQGVPIVHDRDQDSTDLMKCLYALEEKERVEGGEVSATSPAIILVEQCEA